MVELEKEILLNYKYQAHLELLMHLILIALLNRDCSNRYRNFPVLNKYSFLSPPVFH